MTLVDFVSDARIWHGGDLLRTSRCSTIYAYLLSDFELAPLPHGGLASSFVLRTSFNYSIVRDQQISQPEWAKKDLNFRPHAYQACALTN